MIEFVIGIYLLLSAIAASVIARKKNRSTNNWYTIGMFSGIVGVLTVLFMPSLKIDKS